MRIKTDKRTSFAIYLIRYFDSVIDVDIYPVLALRKWTLVVGKHKK